jgi:glutathione S-transferase
MAWTARIEDERGELVRDCGVVTVLDRLWSDADLAAFPWLTTIDPYGDTTFNYRQLKHVVEELDRLAASIGRNDERDEIDQLARWMREMPDRHLYFKVYGD